MYNKEELSIFWFSLFDKITNKKLGQLAEITDSFASLRENLSKYKDEVVKVVGLETYSNLKLSQSDAFIKKMIDKLADKGAKFTTIGFEPSSNASLMAILSTPLAPPDTIVHPAVTRSFVNCFVIICPYLVGFLVPTTAMVLPLTTDISPL